MWFFQVPPVNWPKRIIQSRGNICLGRKRLKSPLRGGTVWEKVFCYRVLAGIILNLSMSLSRWGDLSVLQVYPVQVRVRWLMKRSTPLWPDSSTTPGKRLFLTRIWKGYSIWIRLLTLINLLSGGRRDQIPPPIRAFLHISANYLRNYPSQNCEVINQDAFPST